MDNQKSKRGRKKGSTSFVKLKLLQLSAIFTADEEILVSSVQIAKKEKPKQ